MEFHLPRAIVAAILAHAQQSPEEEVCGLLSARNGIACRAHRIANIADDRRSRFTMEPKGQIEAMRAMRDAGEELFAIYHSHPQGPAHPSATDLGEAAYPGTLYLVVSLDIGGVLALRGFVLREGGFEEAGLVME